MKRKRHQLSQTERRAIRDAARDAYLADPANVLSDLAWAQPGYMRRTCRDYPEGCDGGGYCDGSCHTRPSREGFPPFGGCT